MRDVGIALAEGTRLNDCWRELAEDFASNPAVNEHQLHPLWQAVGGSDEEWVHRANSENASEVAIKRAIIAGRLPLWLRLPDGEVRIDSQAIRQVTHSMIAAGTYLTENYPKSDLEGWPLWVKNSDWQGFRRATLTSRYGARVGDSTVEPPTFKAAEPRKSTRAGGPGRTSKWDWEGAIASVVAKANTPDGLPEGHGAQAAIERLLANFFGDDCPSESQLRLRAAKIMTALDQARR